MTTFSSKQLIASKNTHCEVIDYLNICILSFSFIYVISDKTQWVNLWRACVLNYGESNSLGEMQQR